MYRWLQNIGPAADQSVGKPICTVEITLKLVSNPCFAGPPTARRGTATRDSRIASTSAGSSSARRQREREGEADASASLVDLYTNTTLHTSFGDSLTV